MSYPDFDWFELEPEPEDRPSAFEIDGLENLKPCDHDNLPVTLDDFAYPHVDDPPPF